MGMMRDAEDVMISASLYLVYFYFRLNCFLSAAIPFDILDLGL